MQTFPSLESGGKTFSRAIRIKKGSTTCSVRWNGLERKTQIEKDNLEEDIAFLIDSKNERRLVLGGKDCKLGQLEKKRKARINQEAKRVEEKRRKLNSTHKKKIKIRPIL